MRLPDLLFRDLKKQLASRIAQLTFAIVLVATLAPAQNNSSNISIQMVQGAFRVVGWIGMLFTVAWMVWRSLRTKSE